jgi:hypothetical protein
MSMITITTCFRFTGGLGGLWGVFSGQKIPGVHRKDHGWEQMTFTFKLKLNNMFGSTPSYRIQNLAIRI